MRRPHTKPKRTYALEEVRSLASEGLIYFTTSAVIGYSKLGMKKSEAIDVILHLTQIDFYKSTTEHISENKIYIDVYYKKYDNYYIYIKLKISTQKELVITSFKRGD